MKFVFASLLTLAMYWLLTGCWTQEQPGATIAGQNFAITNLRSEIPDFTPLRKKLLSDLKGAAIPIPDSMGSIFICFGRDVRSRSHYYSLHKRGDGSTSLSEADTIDASTDSIRITFALRLQSDRQTPFPIDIRIVPSANRLLFRWIGSPADDPVPGGHPTPQNIPVDLGKPFPDLVLKDLDGHPCLTRSMRGKPVVIVWWDKGCSAFLDEMSGLDVLTQSLRQRVLFLAITPDSADEIARFLMGHQFRFFHCSGNDEAAQMLGLRFPRAIVLDSAGIIRMDITGGGTGELHKTVEKTLNTILHSGRSQ